MLEKVRSFTLVELIIVVIIVGILASLGLTQYSLIVEKSRLAEAKIRLGNMRQIAYQYYLEHGSLDDIQDADLDSTPCVSTSYYQYRIFWKGSDWVSIGAQRCLSNGKAPNASRQYGFYLYYVPGTDQADWHCFWWDGSFPPCFGYPGT
jgi:prepilin-type N-terminal cleavage/methylation domain-containing protein